MSLFDIGVNLTNKQFAKDQQEVIEQAIAADVSKMVVTGTCVDSAKAGLALAQQWPENLYATAGVHPHDAKDVSRDFIAELAELYQAPQVIAIGECGLDFNRDFSPRPQQESVFEQQIELAVELNAPLFIHQRDAHSRFMAIVKPYADKLNNAVVHCFTGSQQEMQDYLELGFYIGFTGWICDERRGLDVLELTKQIPLERLLIETDAPYLLPRDLPTKPKSRRNQPKYLGHILATIAEARGVDAAELQQQIWQNSCRFFDLDKPPLNGQ